MCRRCDPPSLSSSSSTKPQKKQNGRYNNRHPLLLAVALMMMAAAAALVVGGGALFYGCEASGHGGGASARGGGGNAVRNHIPNDYYNRLKSGAFRARVARQIIALTADIEEKVSHPSISYQFRASDSKKIVVFISGFQFSCPFFHFFSIFLPFLFYNFVFNSFFWKQWFWNFLIAFNKIFF